MKNLDLEFSQQASIEARYENQPVGNFIADLIVENKVIIELKSVRKLALAHEVQLNPVNPVDPV